MIKEEAAHRLGGELQLAQAVARGAVKVVKQQGLEFYIIPSFAASSQECTDTMQDMAKDTKANGEAFDAFHDHLHSLVWKIGDGEAQKVCTHASGWVVRSPMALLGCIRWLCCIASA